MSPPHNLSVLLKLGYSFDNKMKLNKEQLKAFSAILDWANNPIFTQKGRILSGYAGTGKTTLIKLIANELPKCVLCAPTNKAVRILESLNTNCDACTIYSLLGLQMKEDQDKLKLVKIDKDNLSKYKYVIIDEASMLNSELLDYIDSATQKYDVKFLFVGDPEQLNPIGEDSSPIWSRYQSDYLTQIMRHDDEILNLATHVRAEPRAKFSSANNGSVGVWATPTQEFEDEILKSAKNGEFFEKAKAIAWRNATVNRLNELIRMQMFGAISKQNIWIVGDKVVFTDRYKPNASKEIITDEEAFVKISDVCPHPQYGFKCHFLTLELENGQNVEVLTLHESGKETFNKIASDLAALAQKNPKKWKDFWDYKKSVANLKHAYAITTHRSQGSGFHSVFVDSKDILLNSNAIEAKRCLYVAVTRASKRVFIRV